MSADVPGPGRMDLAAGLNLPVSLNLPAGLDLPSGLDLPAGLDRVGSATLREATWHDIPALAALEQDLFGAHAWSEATWWSELAGRPRREYVVLCQDGAILGYAGLDARGDVADVMTVAVAPLARGRGQGRRLVGWLTETAATMGARELWLEVRADNSAAQDLYARDGFALISTRRRYYRPDDVDALVLRKDLT